MLLSSSWAIFIRALLFFFFTKDQLFFVEVLAVFVSISFSIHSYFVQKS